jgi:hypothetical protein
MKTEYQRKREATVKAARELETTKKRLGLGESGPLRAVLTYSEHSSDSERVMPDLEAVPCLRQNLTLTRRPFA